MSWLFQFKQPVPTKHNGVMQLSRFFGVWSLWGHDGTFQAAPYMDGVWRKPIRYVWNRGVDVKRCLILGVAMGSTFHLVQRRWPDADIVGIDWEPELLELGKKLGIYRPDSRIEFIEGDAAAVVPTLKGEFDFIIIDLFHGKNVTEAALDPAMLDALVARLAPGGIVAMNVYRRTEKLRGLYDRLGEPHYLRYYDNLVGAFRKP